MPVVATGGFLLAVLVFLVIVSGFLASGFATVFLTVVLLALAFTVRVVFFTVFAAGLLAAGPEFLVAFALAASFLTV
ncbi:MAG TPA: hypothetical protein VN030_08605 [Cellvibrio sp.]|nr:hypothetical protein [Cellvibrio sp.]